MDNTAAVEKLAKRIYKAMRFDRMDTTPPWENDGNSHAQVEALSAAQAIQADPLAYVKPKPLKGVFADARAKIFKANALRDAVLNMSENRSLTKSVKRALRAYDLPSPEPAYTLKAVSDARISALEAKVVELSWLRESDFRAELATARNEALEKAAKRCEQFGEVGATFALQIRALKTEQGE